MAEQTSEPDPATSTPHPHRTRRLTVVLAAVALAVATGLVAAVWQHTTAGTANDPEVPPLGSPSPATCLSTWNDQAPQATRQGLLVPPGATEALLCSYPYRGLPPLRLGRVHRTTTNLDSLIGYFNHLPTSPPKGVACLDGATTVHTVVFGYPNRRPAVVIDRGCSWDQSGAVRYEGDPKKINSYWGVPWNE